MKCYKIILETGKQFEKIDILHIFSANAKKILCFVKTV